MTVRYVPLNPFKNIVEDLEAFLQSNLAGIAALMLREYEGKAEQRIREMNLTKAVLEETRYVGMVNIHVMNEKYSASNMVTTKDRRYPNVDNFAGEVNSDWFKSRFLNDQEVLKIQLTFKQFRTDNLGISDVIYSTRCEYINGHPEALEMAKLNREDTAFLWNDPAMVVAIKEFYKVVKPVIQGWTPTEEDISTQTIAVV